MPIFFRYLGILWSFTGILHRSPPTSESKYLDHVRYFSSILHPFRLYFKVYRRYLDKLKIKSIIQETFYP